VNAEDGGGGISENKAEKTVTCWLFALAYFCRSVGAAFIMCGMYLLVADGKQAVPEEPGCSTVLLSLSFSNYGMYAVYVVIFCYRI